MEINYQNVKAYVGRAVKQRCKKRGSNFNVHGEVVIALVTYTGNLARPKNHYVREDWLGGCFLKDDSLTQHDVVETATGILSRKAAELEKIADNFYKRGQRYYEYIALVNACSSMIRCLVGNRDDMNSYAEKLEQEKNKGGFDDVQD